MKCRRLFMKVDKYTNESEVVYLESKYNYFDRKEDWFLVRVVSDGRRECRKEKKIPTEVGERLWEMLSGRC